MKKVLLIILLFPIFANAQINIVKNGFTDLNSFMSYNNQLFFFASDGTNLGTGLWKTDGTSLGTVQVTQLTNPIRFEQAEPVVSGGLLYFTTEGDNQLWRTDGTNAGTFMLTNGLTTANFNKIDLNGILIFIGRDSSGDELWRTDGTIAGTYKIVDFNPGPNTGVFSNYNLVKNGNYIYFGGLSSSSQQVTLCKTDGTSAGTEIIPNAGTVQSPLNIINNKIVFNTILEYLPSCVGIVGTPSGVKKILSSENSNISILQNPPTYYEGTYPTYYCTYYGNDFGNTQFFRKSSNNLYFSAYHYPTYGVNLTNDALWVTNGSITSKIKVFPSNTFSVNNNALEPFYFAQNNSIDNSFFDGLFYFPAGDDNTGYEVWRTDGTTTGTFLLKDIKVGSASSTPLDFRTVNGITYFTADDGGLKRKLFKTDGTFNGTVQVPDPNNLLNSPSSNTGFNVAGNQKNRWSNIIGNKFLFAGSTNNGLDKALFSVCTSPQTPILSSNAGNNTSCEGTPVSLTAANCTGIVNWNTGATTSTINVSPASNTTYTATCTNECGVSPNGSITLTVNPLPTIPTFVTRSVTICPSNSVTLLASGCNGTMQWSNSTTGTPFVVSEPGVYTATCSNSCGTSLPSHTFTVRNPSITENLSGTSTFGSINAIQTIASSQTVSSGFNSTYKAGRSITLNPNFTANSGSIFKAEIGNVCPITNGLVLHLPFDGNTNDISGGNNNGTASNATLTTDRDGKPNSAYYFNGNNAYISVPNNPSFSGNTELTLSAWIRPEDLNGTYRGIITKWFQNASSDTYAILLANTNQILAAVKGNPEIFSGMISANNWIQVVYTHSSTLDNIYINGVLVSSINVSASMPSTTIPIIIGADNNNGTIWRFFKGKIDEVKIYNRALTIQEIEYQYAFESIPTNINTGLVASYNLDNNANDQSGNGHHTTFTNTTVTTGRKSDVNGAYSFNGINQRINLGTWFNLQSFTISMWLNAGSAQANAYAMIIDNNHGGNLMWNMQQRNTTLNLYDFGLSGSPGTGQAFNLTPNQWTHIVITCNGSTLSLYKDGVLEGSSTYTGPIIYNGTQSLCLGAYVNGGNHVRYWAGKMDDIKIYNRALSEVEVSYLFSE